MKKRAVGYCRISTLMQVDNTSLKDQEDKIRMYAKLHDIVIDEMFIDKAVSGKSTDRPEYDKMMDYVKENNIDMIIVYKNDRIHRSLYNLLAMIYELQKYEVALVSVTEMFDTSTPQGMLFLQMLGSFAEFERAVINERTRNGRIARLNEKKYLRIDCLKSNKKLNNIYENHNFKLIRYGNNDRYSFSLRECNVDE